MKTYTIEMVRAFLADQQESDEPETILEVFRRNDGKPLTRRILSQLPGGEERWILVRDSWITKIVSRDYLRTGGNTGYSFNVGRAGTGVLVSARYLEQHNTCYFSGRRERTAERLATLNDPIKLGRMTEALNAVQNAAAHLAVCEEALNSVIDGAFSADRYDWQKLAEGKDGGK